MKTLHAITAAVLCAALSATVLAEDTPGDAGLQFDFNRDGVTDSSDWEALRAFSKDYKMSDEDGDYFACQEEPATLTLLIDELYGNRSSHSYEKDLSAVPEYYLPSLGDSTVVKNQDPFGTCWAFGGISSVESNLLRKRHNDFDNPAAYSLDLGSASSEPDLSELFLAYENCEPVVSGPQSGEGMSPLSNDINNHFSVGGFASSLQSIFAAWDGPVSEEQEPYKPVSAEDSGAAVYDLRSEDKDRNDPPAAHIQKFIYLDDSVQFHVDLDRKVYAFDSCDQQAVDRAKQALYQYGALMLCYGADMSMPNEAGDATYFDYNHWSQYSSADTIAMNHMVSVVGWNDNYPKENFSTEAGTTPPQNGAWLVKNSWGNYESMFEAYGDRLVEVLENAKGTPDEILMNRYYNYGIPDENGHGTGYFWLSYYDQSITAISALDADDGSDGFDYDHIYQYDYILPMSFTMTSLPASNSDTKVANVFQAEQDETLYAVSVQTPQPDCKAEIQVYLLEGDSIADPTAGTLIAAKELTLPEKGFHTIDLDQPVSLAKDTVFAVVEKITSANGMTWLNLETILKPELQTPDNINNVTNAVVSNSGESYAFVHNGADMVWVSSESMNETPAGTVFAFGNAHIKAYTRDGLSGTAKPIQNTALSGGFRVGWILAGIAVVLGILGYFFIFRKKQTANE